MKNNYYLLWCLLLMAVNVSVAQIPTDGLIGYYPFHGNANDESDKAHQSQVKGALLTFDRCGHANSAYSFSGFSTYINCGVFDLKSKPFSISLWIQSKGNPAYGTSEILNHGDARTSQHNLHLRINPDKTMRFSFFGYKGLTVDTEAPLEIENWYHAVFVYNHPSRYTSIYIDGQRVQEGTFAGDYLGTDSLYLGRTLHSTCANGWDAYFDGKLDDIRIYDRVLNQSEIQSLATESPCQEKNMAHAYSIYPNPVSTELKILAAPGYEDATISIARLEGSTVYRGQLKCLNQFIDMRNISPGLYVIQLSKGSQVLTRKLIKQ